jgi:hypothetical protein
MEGLKEKLNSFFTQIHGVPISVDIVDSVQLGREPETRRVVVRYQENGIVVEKSVTFVVTTNRTIIFQEVGELRRISDKDLIDLVLTAFNLLEKDKILAVFYRGQLNRVLRMSNTGMDIVSIGTAYMDEKCTVPFGAVHEHVEFGDEIGRFLLHKMINLGQLQIRIHDIVKEGIWVCQLV